MTKLGWLRRLLCFDYFGVSRHTPKNYSVTDPTIWEYSPQQQACWADAISVAHASDPIFLERMIFQEKDFILNDPDSLNTTSIGNCAYLATSKNVPCQYREHFRNIIATFRDKMAPKENKHKDYAIEVDYFAWPEWLHPIRVFFGVPWFIVERFDLICILLIFGVTCFCLKSLFYCFIQN